MENHTDSRKRNLLAPLYFFLVETPSHSSLSQLFNLRREAEVSYYCDLSVIQESFRFRALNRARTIASFLINDQGEWELQKLNELLEAMDSHGYVFNLTGTSDGFLTEFMHSFLKRLSPQLMKSISRFHHPVCHKWAERLILDSLGLYTSTQLTTPLVRRAILSACLTPLRQNVGSCFATAPAILIQREQVETFLDDLYQLVTTGTLKRVFAGVEYTVPLSPSMGSGDLRKQLVQSDNRAIIWLSPGLIAACDQLELFPPSSPTLQKAEILKHKLASFQGDVQTFIHEALLEKWGIKEQDLISAEQIEQMQLKTSRLMPIATDRGASKKVEVLTQFKRKEREAKAAFMGLCDHALLKAWEFSLASFSDIKMEFSTWNLYTSLGLSASEPGGIGELLANRIEEKIREINEKIELFQREYEAALSQARGTEILLKQAGSETEARRLQAEYQSRAYHMRSCLEMRDQIYSEGSHYTNLFNQLIKQYGALFPEFFQEIFDPDMQEATTSLSDDSKAGFRLVYKHGRSDPSQWTLIYTAEQWIFCLTDFFSLTESRIASEMQWEQASQEVLAITSAIIELVRSEHFLQAALQRMSREASGKTPWSYVSGGTMTTLLKTYFCRENEFTIESKWVANESELAIFAADTLKHLMPLITTPFLTAPHKAMLMNSPTHAFLLLPGLDRLRSGWQEEGFTYTWVRDQIFLPNQTFYAQISLSLSEQQFLLDQLSEELPPQLSHALHQSLRLEDHPLSVTSWRQQVLSALLSCTQVQHSQQKDAFADGLDAFLFQALPLVPAHEWKSRVRRLLSDLFDPLVEKSMLSMKDDSFGWMTAQTIKELALICYLNAYPSLCTSFDLHQYIAEHARFIGLAQPAPLLIADTNWTIQYLGFVVNPGTARLELWGLDRTASQGIPMTSWNPWLNGSHKKPWLIYANPMEYSR